MVLQMNKKEKKILLFGTLIIILLILLGYFNFLKPIKSNVEAKKNQLKTNEQIYQSLLEQKTEDTETFVENSQYLQKRLPVKPLMNQFILDLEKAETLSNSLIIHMVFGTDTKNESSNTTEEYLDQSIQEDDTDTDQKSEAAQPSGIEKISVRLLINSPSYFDLEKFLETIEDLDRIVTVESIHFTGKPEVTSLEHAEQSLNYEVSLSLYYMPGLEDLQNEIPKVESGKPANKRNPLNQFDEIMDNEDES